MLQPTTASQKLLCFLAYISILFLPVILPLIIWIVASNKDTTVASHAKRAFISQLFPAIYLLVVAMIYLIMGLSGMAVIRNAGGWFAGLLIVIALLISLILYIYNLAMAIRVLLDR